MIRFFGYGTVSILVFALLATIFGPTSLAVVTLALAILTLMITLILIDNYQIDHPEELALDPSFELTRDYLQAQRDLDEAARRAQGRSRGDDYPGEVQRFPPWL